MATMMFVLSGCAGIDAMPSSSSGPDSSSATATPERVMPNAPAEQACADMAGPFAVANAGMLGLVADQKVPPQEVVDMWTEMVDVVGTISETAMSQDVKDAAAATQTDFAALRDAMQKVYVEGGLSAMGDYVRAATRIQDSYSALLALCSPAAAP